MAEKAGFEGEGEVEFRSPGKIRDARDEGFQETCRTCQDSNKTPKRHARDNEICVRPGSEAHGCQRGEANDLWGSTTGGETS